MKHSTLLRNIVFAFITGATVLGLLAAPSNAATQRSRGQAADKDGVRAAEIPKGPGSVSGAPHLPAGFADTFKSRYVDIGSLRLHTVIGGKGRPLLLIHGWPQTWYQWRLVMPALAQDFQVIAVDQRGIGLSDKPETGYDSGTQANDLIKPHQDYLRKHPGAYSCHFMRD